MAPAHRKLQRSERAFSHGDEYRKRQPADDNGGKRDRSGGYSEYSKDGNSSQDGNSHNGPNRRPYDSTGSYPRRSTTAVVETVTQLPSSLVGATTAASSTLTASPSILQNSVAQPTVQSSFTSTISTVPAFPYSTPAVLPTFTNVLPSSSLLPTSTRGRKGVYGDDGANPIAAEIPNATVNTSLPANTANVAAAETQPPYGVSAMNDGNNLSSGAENALIAVGVIGGVILVAFIVYIALRFLKIDLWSKFGQRKQQSSGPTLDGPYWKPAEFDAQSFGSIPEEKQIPRQKHLEAFFNTGATNTITTITEVQISNAERQARIRSALLENYGRDGGLHVLNPDPVLPSPSLAPSVMPLATELPARTRSRPPTTFLNTSSEPFTSAPGYNNTSRISDLSSLSSGFGDARIDVPESGPSLPGTMNTTRTSIMNRGNKDSSFFGTFSWMRDQRSSYQSGRRGSDTRGNRDTTYTTTSEDSEPPRFRGVNSWVNQQSNRVTRKMLRQDEAEDEVRNMPSLPAATVRHQRGESEVTNPAFKYHPGDEVPVARGSRVPSAILNKL